MPKRFDWKVIAEMYNPRVGYTFPRAEQLAKNPLFNFGNIGGFKALRDGLPRTGDVMINLPHEPMSFCGHFEDASETGIWFHVFTYVHNPERVSFVVNAWIPEEPQAPVKLLGMLFADESGIKTEWLSDEDLENSFGPHFRTMKDGGVIFTLVCVEKLRKLKSRYHPVIGKDTETNRKANWKRPWKRADLPILVFVDSGAKIDAVKGTTVRGPFDGERVITAHPRRGHYKTLKHERFKDKRGSKVWVRPTWVGPKEWKYNNVTYRVVS